ncbi:MULTISPECIES: tyrosine-type recombinase/integrase [Yersinia]|uniref:tyrosine-type recombinase/integrase n=1 Tax=Yersinia TaxID=629 RepID=UPI0005E983D3|nr:MULTISPECIES: tyrosine-type recombinase/integrase [Yersinia]EKN4178735.1 tyrosine-type recombinase/integrase [Yersinia enterocolitica]MDA5473894.1 tyrosine-type recombinase/integrase [Yersinia kristensenii]MDA5478349.1 tyrosine-type recombinase/integrase [Yersinia kristensenii]MDA5507113.1 tyrosine-type recombinase/integrase [Yersinia kristensenii]MDA5523268.1 tyrosine-type recombinase/integrase [Yersinia kristensenii]
MKLNARQVDTAKPKEKPYKLSDGGGLFLLVKTTGSRCWRLKYRIAGKEKLLAFGVYPDITLAEARAKRDEAKRILAVGGDPGEEKKVEKQTRKVSIDNTFEALAREWHAYKRPNWSKGYAEDLMESFEKDIFPYVGKRPVAEIKPLEILETLRKLEKRGVLDKMRKIRQACSQTFRYAIVTGRAENNPASELAGALAVQKHTHYPHLLANELPAYLNALNAYSGSTVTRIATRLLMLTGVRTTELRAAEWLEFDLDKAVWEVPTARMKMRRPHLVPLSEQVLALLRQLHEITGRFKLVFPGRNDSLKPMSEASINQVIKRIGYHGKATGHGFRHTMSTILHEQGFNTAWIETQLAHVDKNSIRGTYNHAQYLDGRREMLQWYADYMDSLERQSKD